LVFVFLSGEFPMGIRITCPHCSKQLNVKSFLAGKRGVCPDCKTKFDIPIGGQHNVVLEVEESDHTTALRQTELLRQQQALQPPFLAAAPVASSMPAGPQPLSPLIAPSTIPIAMPVVASPPPASPPLATAVPVATLPDPIAEAPHASWHLCSPTGNRYGPVVGELLRQWIAERRVTPDTLVWREGWPDWQRADAVLVELAAAQPVLAGSMALAAGVPATVPAVELPFTAEPLRRPVGRPYNRRSKSMHGLMIALLVLAVLILAPLLGYVLYQQF
jgi:hypothetical protein